MSAYDTTREQRALDGTLLSELDIRTFTAIRRLVESGDEVWIVVTGVSMRPTLEPGDRVLLTRGDQGPLAGRIVLANLVGRPVLHRVITQRHGLLVTAGDGCVRADPPVPKSAIVARAEAVCSTGGLSALRPTMRFGVAPLARYVRLEVLALSLRIWRRARHRRPVRIWIWSNE